MVEPVPLLPLSTPGEYFSFHVDIFVIPSGLLLRRTGGSMRVVIIIIMYYHQIAALPKGVDRIHRMHQRKPGRRGSRTLQKCQGLLLRSWQKQSTIWHASSCSNLSQVLLQAVQPRMNSKIEMIRGSSVYRAKSSESQVCDQRGSRSETTLFHILISEGRMV